MEVSDIYEMNLEDFDFSEVASGVFSTLTEEELEILAEMIEENYPDGISEEELNDLFEDFDTIEIMLDLMWGEIDERLYERGIIFSIDTF